MRKILVAEDDRAIRNLVSVTLTSRGYEVAEAADGIEALEMLEAEEVDLVVLDVMMPRLDGWGVLRELRRTGLRRKTRVVILTAKASESDILTGWRLGADDYVTKPFEPEHLARRIEETLFASPRQLEERRREELERAELLSRVQDVFE